MYVRGSNKNIEYKRDLNGFFRGIIMDDADFKKLYRCKIFIPELHTIPYTEVKGKQQYTAPDKIGSLPPDVHKALLDMLPWAEQASSLFGEQSTSHYSASREAQTGGVNYPQESRRTNPPNSREMGTYPSQVLANASATSGPIADNNPLNPTGNIYAPAPNAPNAHGIHGTPSVGAHVWVFFDRGDINCPVYFAACPSGAETNQVMQEMNVTGYSSNYGKQEVEDTPPEPRRESNLNREKVTERSDLNNIDPETKRKLYELMQAEVGGQGRDAQVAFMETVANRAAAEGRSIDSIVSDRRYYEPLQKGITKPVNSTTQAKYDSVFEEVASGSNITNGATHNASAGVARRVNAGGYDANIDSIIVIGGETFYNKEFPREQNWLKRFNETS